MALSPPFAEWGFLEADADVETIDLTGSSPEPEARPRMPLQQQRLPAYFKTEPRADFNTVAHIKTERNVPANFARNPQNKARPIHPYHMAQIVNTSDPDALRSVVLNLCKISPALSGAVARGLAPHSTFAQGLIKQQQQTSRASVGISVKNEDSDDQTYERMKQRLAPKKISQKSRSPSNYSNLRNIHAAAPKSEPHVKRERQADTWDSDWNFDLDLNVSGAYPLSTHQNRTFHSPLRDASGSNAVSYSPKPFSLSRRVALQNVTKVKAENMVCTRCHLPYGDEFEACFYHSGVEFIANGVNTCNDCNGPMSDLGCAIGMHISDNDIYNDFSKPNQASGSQSPSKKPRIW